MDLIRIACIMLAIAFFIGILTGGDKDTAQTDSVQLESQTIRADSEELTGTQHVIEKNEDNEDNKENTENKENNKEDNENNKIKESDSELASKVKNTPQAQMAPEEISSPAAGKPAPDPLVFQKGESKIASEKQNIEKKVKATARLIEARGDTLFPSFREKGSAWYQDNFCIFIWTEDGTQVVCPSDSSSEGKNLRGLQALDGKPIGEMFIKTAMGEKGEGWIEYNWQENGEYEPSQKFTFVKRASFEGKSYIVGADFSVNNYIISRNLEECKFVETPGNNFIAELLNPAGPDKNLNLNCSVSCSSIEPGENNVPHLIRASEIHYVLEGEGLLYIDGIPFELKKDQFIFIPAGSVQTTYNTGNTILKFLIIDQPPRVQENVLVIE